MQRKNNQNNLRKENRTRTRYGRAARFLSIMMTIIFGLSSLATAVPAAASDITTGSVEESTASGKDSASDSSTPSSSETPKATAYSDKVDLQEKNGKLTVTAEANPGILPENAVLTVKPITKANNKTAYQQIEDKVRKNVADDNRELTGFLAYDISFKQNNKEIEPKGKVNVTMDWSAAAKPADQKAADDKDAKVSVLHLEENKSSKDISDTTVVNLTENKEKGKTNQASVVTKKDTKAVEKAEMTVNSFSVFTITWTKSNDDATRIGSVKVRYISTKGKELDIKTTGESESEYTEDELGRMSQTDGGIIDLSNWAKNVQDADDTTANYVYDHAAIGDRQTGITITGVKVQQGKETRQVRTGWDEANNGPTYTPVEVTNYKLYYTNDSTVDNNSKWTLYRDSASEASGNTANIFLIYKTGTSSSSNDPTQIILHHVDKYGAQLASDTTDGFGFLTNGSRNTSFVGGWNGSSTGNGGSYFQRHAATNQQIGTFLNGYIGSGNLNNDTYKGDGGLFYMKDSTTGIWHTGTGAFSGTKNSNGSYTSVTNEIKDSNNNAVLYTDVYELYSGKKGLTIHYVDKDGKELHKDGGTALNNGDTFSAAEQTLTGYAYQSAHLGSYDGKAFTTITDTQNGEDWTSSVKNGDETVAANSPVNEVWLVYSKENVSKTFTVHYQYKDESAYKDAVIYDRNDSTGKNTETKTVSSSDGQVKMTPLDLVNDAQTDSWLPNDVRTENDTKLTYMSTRLGSSDGPKVTHVSINDDGTIVYHSTFGRRMTESRNNQWTYTETTGELKGRRWILTREDDGNLSLKDSQNGTVTLNYANDSGTNGDASVSASYTATIHGEVTTTEYTVTSRYETTGSSTTPTHYYDLIVEDSSPSTATDVYEVYTTNQNANGELWIDDDTKYSGLYRTGISDELSTKLASKTVNDIKYEWHRVAKKDGSQKTDTVVSRKQTGEHFNIAYADADRTWLDLEADEGSDVWTYGTKYSYYVKLSYRENGTEKTTQSNTVTVNYYGDLENGDFDNPTIQGNANYSYYGNNNNAINGYFSNTPTSDGKNYSDEFVWKTTQPGTGNNNHKDIEVVNTASTQTGNNSWKHAYVWTSAGNWDSYRSDGADSGKQFAELNAEAAGALYQDVITHPNEKLNYWFAHRARRDTYGAPAPQGKTTGNPVEDTPYDSMYLVIMPTKLAMTLGDKSTELVTQSELEKFIDEHGGYDTDRATEEEDKITYRDDDSGILIRKVSSDDNDWHKIVATNGYTAKGGLTRFFFVAGRTASSRTDGRDNTIGNFLDSVGFDQSLPPTEGFNITFTETFSGITMEQLAGLASNAKDVDGVVAQAHPLQLTVSNTHNNTSDGTSQGAPNDALNRAKLSFTVEKNKSGYTITPTAVANDGTTDLFKKSDTVTKPGSYDVKTNSDGSITISWIFPDQILRSNAGEAQSERFTYSVDDYVTTQNSSPYSTTDIAGYMKVRSRNAVYNGTTSLENNIATTAVTSTIGQNDSATLNIINVYSPDTHISVRKTFSGVTPSTVKEMMEDSNKPYTITIKKQNETTSETLKLTGNDSDVSVSSVTGTNGDTAYIWTITKPGWTTGTYEISESNYTTTRNELRKITLNESTDIAIGSNNGPTTATNVVVRNTDQGNLTFGSSDSLNDGENASYVNPGSNINLIVGQYGNGTNMKYVVWTESAVGLATRNAIITKINNLDWTNKTTANNTNISFYSGMNNGAISITNGERSLQFDGTYLTLQGTENNSWNQYYATHYNVTGHSSLEDDSEIRITNEYVPKIKIQKQDAAESSDGGHVRLNNAVFRLYKLSDSNKLYYQDIADSESEGDLWKAVDATEAKAKEFTTANASSTDNFGDGIAMLPTNLTVNTTYYLEEYKAPDGYNRVADIPFKIKADGTVTLLNSADEEITTTDTDPVQLKFVDPYYTFIISDSAGSALPETGGHGTWPFILSGAVIVLIAGTWLWLRHSRSKKG